MMKSFINKSKTKISNILTMLFLILLASLLTACNSGAVVDTKLEIDSELKGQRTIDIKVSEGAFNDNFSGSVQELNELIDNNKPECMEYSSVSIVEDGVSYYDYKFIIPFSSKIDYENKIHDILGEDIRVTVDVPQNAWSRGIYIDEGFSSLDLMEWLRKAIIEEGMVTEENSGYIFTNGKVIVAFENEEYETAKYIKIDKIANIDVDEISILLNLNADESFDLDTVFKIPQRSMKIRGVAIRVFIEKLQDERLVVTEEVDEEGNGSFILSARNLSASELENYLSRIFGNGHITLNFEDSDTDLAGPFSFSEIMDVSVDYMDYLGSSNSSARTSFLIKLPKNYGVFELTDDNETIELVEKDAENFDYVKLYDEKVEKRKGRYLVSRILSVKNLKVYATGDAYAKNWLKRSEFYFENAMLEGDEEMILQRFSDRINSDSDHLASKVSAQFEMNNKEKCLVIEEKGECLDLVESSKKLFEDKEALMYVASEPGSMKIMRKYGFVWHLDYSGVLTGSADDFTLECSFKGPGNILNYAENSKAEYKQKGSSLIVTSKEKSAEIEVYGKSFDSMSFIIGGLFILGIIVIVIGIFLMGNSDSEKP